MIKNIILDVGGVIIDDSLENISKVYGKDMRDVYKKVYSKDFQDCILGKSASIEVIRGYQYVRLS